MGGSGGRDECKCGRGPAHHIKYRASSYVCTSDKQRVIFSFSFLLQVCSKYCMGHTDTKNVCFIYLKRGFNWISCILTAKLGNPV